MKAGDLQLETVTRTSPQGTTAYPSAPSPAIGRSAGETESGDMADDLTVELTELRQIIAD